MGPTSLSTGAPRAARVTCEGGKQTMAAVLARHPALMARIAEPIETRRHVNGAGAD